MRSVFLLVPNIVYCCARVRSRGAPEIRPHETEEGPQTLDGGILHDAGPSHREACEDEPDTLHRHCFRLDNTIQVDFLKTDKMRDQLYLNISVDTGLEYMSKGVLELANLAKRISTLSPQRHLIKYDLHEFYESYSMTTTPGYTSFYVSFKTDSLPKVLERLYRGTAEPYLNNSIIKNEILIIASELRMFYSDPFGIHNFVKPQCFEGDCVYDSTPIENMKVFLGHDPKNKLEDFYKRCYGFKQIKILVVGDCDSGKLREHLNATFGQISNDSSHEAAIQMPRLKREFADRLVQVRPPLVFSYGQHVSKLTITFPEYPIGSFVDYMALCMLKGFLLESYRGGFKPFLINEGYAAKYSSNICGSLKNSFHFEVTVILTDKGNQKIQEIAHFLSQYLDIWRKNIGDYHIEIWRRYIVQEIRRVHSDLSSVGDDEKVNRLVWFHNRFSFDDIFSPQCMERVKELNLKQFLDCFLKLTNIHYVHETTKGTQCSTEKDAPVPIITKNFEPVEDANTFDIHIFRYFCLNGVFEGPKQKALSKKSWLSTGSNPESRPSRCGDPDPENALLEEFDRFAKENKTEKPGELKIKVGVVGYSVNRDECSVQLKNECGMLKMAFDRNIENSCIILNLDYNHLNDDLKSVMALKIILESVIDRFLKGYHKRMEKAQCVMNVDNKLSAVFVVEFKGRSDMVLFFADAFVKTYNKRVCNGRSRMGISSFERYKRLLCYRISELFRGNTPPILYLAAKEAFLGPHNILKTLMDGLSKVNSPEDLILEKSVRVHLSATNIPGFKAAFKLFCMICRHGTAVTEDVSPHSKENVLIEGYIGHRLHNMAAVFIKMDDVDDAVLATFTSLIRPHFCKKIRSELGEYQYGFESLDLSIGAKVLVVLIGGQAQSTKLKDEITRFIIELPLLIKEELFIEDIAKEHGIGTQQGPDDKKAFSGIKRTREVEDLRRKLVQIARDLISGYRTVSILTYKENSQEVFMNFL